ncbi:MAG: FtsB family cell division protein [Flavobacteriales bacterium]
MLRKLTDRIPPRLRNRYGASLGLFLAWVMFFAEHDLWQLFKSHRELDRILEQQAWYEQALSTTREELALIGHDKELLEKFARERYLMKRENEEIFVLVPEE